MDVHQYLTHSVFSQPVPRLSPSNSSLVFQSASSQDKAQEQ